MKLKDCMVEFIGNSKFCTIDEAIEYALELSSEAEYLAVMNRSDMTLKKAISFAYNVNQASIWEILVKREDLDFREAQKIAVQTGKNKIWKAIAERRDIPFSYIAKIAESLGKFDLWKVVLLRQDTTPPVVIAHALHIDDSLLWEATVERKDILMYLETLPLCDALKVARSSKSGVIWHGIIFKRALLPRDMLFHAIEANKAEIFRLLKQNDEVVAYLKSAPSIQIIEIAKELYEEPILSIILSRSDIKPQQIFSWLEAVGSNVSVCKVFDRNDMKVYISRLSLKAAFDLAQKIGYEKACKSQTLKDMAQLYVLTAPKKRVLEISMNVKDKLVAAQILSYDRPDLPIREVIKCAKAINIKLVWSAVVDRPDFIDYFDSMSDSKALLFAEECDNSRIWSKLFVWRDIDPAKIIEIGKRINESEVWKIIKLREDVNLYLNS